MRPNLTSLNIISTSTNFFAKVIIKPMNTDDTNLVQAASEWHGRITELRALITQLEAEVIEAEVKLAEEITAVNAFEFKLRAGVSQLMGRLDELAGQIAELRKKLRHHYDFAASLEGSEWGYEQVEGAFNEPGLDHENYRFHSTIPKPSEAALDGDETAELKRLYRQLARRFHPDMGLGDADRAYRTQLMMAINAAYAAGDLERLKELAKEPDLTDLSAIANDDKQMVNFLLRELARLQRRLSEIQGEMELVQSKKNYRLMQQARRAEENGKDWVAEMRLKMQDEIAQKLVERDVLRQELEIQEMITAEESGHLQGAGLQGEGFAEAILDISLDATFEVDPDLVAEDWLFRRRGDKFPGEEWGDDEE